MRGKEKIVERGIGYEIYYSDGRFFINTYKAVNYSYETLRGAKEALYYAGLIDSTN